jgi:dihydropteroate synthase
MGILNVTPDSFYDGGKFDREESAVEHALQMVNEGVDIIDIGAESSRPGADPIDAEIELKRILKIVKVLTKEIDVPLSIDSYKPEVLEKCMDAGAHIINDITGLSNEKVIQVSNKYSAPVVLMHMLGEPKTMQDKIQYTDVVEEVYGFLKKKIQWANERGLTNLIIDPGIGFGKTVEDNLKLIHQLELFKSLNCPILIGTSRKSFIGKISNMIEKDRLPGSISSAVVAAMNGASIVRVHDVKETVQAMKIVDAIKSAK